MEITSLTALREKLEQVRGRTGARQTPSRPAKAGVVLHLMPRAAGADAAIAFDAAKGLVEDIRRQAPTAAALEAVHDLDWQRVARLIG
ncbi:MAG: hypothetical protein AAGU21_06590 [Solidesulfovibrio sp.]|uniref:hypothetical protein n=1 Tax=Solidesulfovibrio sp. TaxID=2910990 RepID=UPI002B1F5B77|nr:hypothetical protein [Solidesulfovibrio sp.]MEA4856841.1 hypothetical protein [Solidesulfovibrio sp.]